MIAYLGMSEKLPNLCYYNNDEYSFNKPYSEKTAELIDEEVKAMVNEQYERAKKILSENKEGHNALAQQLIEKEVIFSEDVEHIFGKRPWASRSEEIVSAELERKKIEAKTKENKEKQALNPTEEAALSEDSKQVDDSLTATTAN
jgi:cell division protease FtsH